MQNNLAGMDTSRRRVWVATIAAGLLLLAAGPRLTDRAAAGTRMRPIAHATQYAAAKLPVDEDCPEPVPVRKQGDSLSLAHRAALMELASERQAGRQFSIEETSLLNLFQNGLQLETIEAEVLISRALLFRYVLNQSLSPEQTEVLSRYLAYLSAKDREPADLKRPTVTPAEAESEPNELVQHANPVASRISGVISTADDTDTFAFDAAGPGVMAVSLELAGSVGRLPVVVEVFDETGAAITTSSGAQRAIHCAIASAGRYFIKVAQEPGTDPIIGGITYALSIAAVCASESVSREDPRMQRVHPFEQGTTCLPGPMRHYEAYEYVAATAGTMTASLCPDGGGSSDFDSFLLVYQAPGGTRITPFAARGCENALAANNDFCGESAQVTASVAPGYFYVVATGRCGESLGSFALEVVKDGSSLACTRVTPPGGGTGEPHIAVTMTDGPDPAPTNGLVVYSIQIVNEGHGPRQDVVLTDVLPAEAAYESCTTTLGTCSVSGNTVTVDIGRLEAGSSVSVTISARVGCDVASGTAFGNTATVRSRGGGHDEEAVFAEVSCSTVTTVTNPAPVIGSTPAVHSAAAALQGCVAGSYVEFPMPPVTDNCPGPVSVTCAPVAGSFFPVGTTIVSVVATDSYGASSSTSFPVIVATPFGVCCFGDGNGDSFRQVIDSTSPLYGYWQYTVAATGVTYCGIADSVTYVPGRSLTSYDRTDPTATMTATISYSSGTAVIRLVVRATGQSCVLRDRNIANTPPC